MPSHTANSGADRIRLAAAALAGALLASAFPPFGISIFAWIALVPLIWSLEGARPRQAAGRGYLAGLVFMAGVGLFTTSFGSGVLWMTLLPWFLFTAIEALWFIPLAIAISVGLRPRSAIPALLGVPAFWVLTEWGRSSGTYGFPFGGLAAATVNSPTTQWAAVGGCWLVSGIVAFAGAAVYLLVFRSRRTGFWALSALIPLFIWGHLATKRDDGNDARITVRVAQGASNSPWGSPQAEYAFEAMRAATLAGGGHPDLVIWSESAIPSAPFADPRLLRRVTDVAAYLRAPLLTGAILYSPQEDPSNAAVLFRPDRSVAGVYRKRQLVPYGEFVPLRTVLPLLSDFGVVDKDEVPGTEYNILQSGNMKIGCPVCFESASPRAAKAFANGGANLLVIITNDGWFGRSGMADQHVTEARLRAIETRRWVVRVAHTGISCFIASTGEIVKCMPLGHAGALTGEVALRSGRTPFVAVGNWFVILSGFIAASALWAGMGIHTPPAAHSQPSA